MDVKARLEVTLGGAQYRLMTRGAARLAGLTESEAQIEGLRIPFFAGGWGVPVVLIHGFGADKESWLPIARQLRAKGRSLLIVDLPGFGAASAIPPERASAARQARIVAGLLDRLGYGRVHLIGSSMGGGISIRFASDHSDRALSLTLIGSVGPLVEKSELFYALDRGENPLLVDSPDDLERLVGFVVAKPRKIPRTVARYLGHDRFARREDQERLFRGWIDPKEGEQVPSTLESIATPALVIHGSRDRVIDPSTGRALAARLPNARLEMLEGIGHVPHMEVPRHVAKLVNRFIDEVDAARAEREESLLPVAAW
jgi:abhydrolase domain-containing protein 6